MSDTVVDRLLSHWAWVVPMLLVVAALSLRQSDLYPPAEDEFYSMHNAGWLLRHTKLWILWRATAPIIHRSTF